MFSSRIANELVVVQNIALSNSELFQPIFKIWILFLVLDYNEPRGSTSAAISISKQ